MLYKINVVSLRCKPIVYNNDTIITTKKLATMNKNANVNGSAKRVNNRRRAAKETAPKMEAAAAAVVVVEDVPVVDVEAIETQTEEAAATLPAVKEAEIGKVSSKDVLKAAGSLRAAVKEERRGANCTIRLIAERAAAGDTAAVDVLCALCDIPRAALFSLNLDTIRAAVNAWYPYYIEDGTRKVSVKPAGVWYTTAASDEAIEDAAKRVQRGYMVVPVTDYLDQLIKAAKCRAKGITPRRVDSDAVYSDNKLSTAAAGITASDIDAAKQRRVYASDAANVWHKDRYGFYI